MSVQRFYSAIVVEKVARPNVQTIKAKSSQPNKSLNLTSPALRGGQRSGAVKRAPQVSSSPLGCAKREAPKIEIFPLNYVGFNRMPTNRP